MKKTVLLFLPILLSTTILHAQTISDNDDSNSTLHEQKNVIKLNLFALALKSVTVEYERRISRKTTVALDLRVMPKSTLPFKSSFESSISDSTTKSQLDNFKTGNFAIMPQIRFYLSRRGAYHGFYIAPFFSYAHYTADVPYNYTDNGVDKTIPLAGTVNTVTGGIMFGAQWALGKTVYLDWWIFGPHYGGSSGSLVGRQSLSSSEQQALQSDFNSLDIPIANTTSTVDANGATLNFSGPWAGLRSGLCIGFRF